ncbi:hypothetical protein [Olleya sp. R77988]|uniref:hypothetical protein n=1 Tax=Olleya sp. R77988 TaxID=3093875 RepID=UPI0037C76BEA
MHNPNILKGSDVKITNLDDAYKVSIPGYRLKLNTSTFLRILLFGFSIFVISFLLYRQPENASPIVLSTILVLVIFFAVFLHTKTTIVFSKNGIKVRHGFLPFVRKRKTQHLTKIYIDDSVNVGSDSTGGNFIYLVLSFSKGWKIKIIVDHLSRQETEFVTSRLSYFRYKFLKK